MKKIVLWLLFIITVAYAWEDDDYDGICPLTVCHSRHVDTQYDVNHCGGCDIKCFPNQICINGTCTCPNNNNACGAACTACPIGQHCDGYQCVCDNTVGSCGSPGFCTSCSGATPECINGACACSNNNLMCGSTCTACSPDQHCELANGTSECISSTCPNTQTACGSACTACSSATPECINGVCTCPNSDTACTNSPNGACATCNSGQYCDLANNGGTCTCLNSDAFCLNGPSGSNACAPCNSGQYCDLANNGGTCTCLNSDTACTNSPNGGITVCTDCGNTPSTPRCFEGTCLCPNTPTQCSSVTNCGTCDTATGEVCVNGACGCCVGNTCTQCPTGSTGCTASGACCIPSGSGTCTADADCCADLICDTTSSTCVDSAVGCFDLNSSNQNVGVNVGASCAIALPWTQATCLEACANPLAAYYSLTYNAASADPYCCICYSSAYQFFPLTDGDQPCTPPPQAGNTVYGRYNGAQFAFAPPSSEYVYIK